MGCADLGTKSHLIVPARQNMESSYTAALTLSVHFAFRFGLALLLLSSSLFLPFEMRISIPCLSHYCILGIHNLFDFTGSQLESKWPQDELFFGISHT
jgi:hypothetical protein